MPAFLEAKLKKEYGDNPRAIYGTMNKLGAMKGNKETAKGRAMQRKHDRKRKSSQFAKLSRIAGGKEMNVKPPQKVKIPSAKRKFKPLKKSATFSSLQSMAKGR